MPRNALRYAGISLLVLLGFAGCRRGPTVLLRFPSERVFLNSVFGQLQLYELGPGEEELCVGILQGVTARSPDVITEPENICSFERGTAELRGVDAGRWVFHAVVTDVNNAVIVEGCRAGSVTSDVDIIEVTLTPTPAYTDDDPICASVEEKCEGICSAI